LPQQQFLRHPPQKKRKKKTHTHTQIHTHFVIFDQNEVLKLIELITELLSELTTELLSGGRLQKIIHKIYPYWALSLGTNLNLKFFRFMPKITIKAGPK
jgi:fructose-1,6-bisphosphatase